MKVDLPDPDGPITATNSPASMSMVTPRSARTLISPRSYTFAELLDRDTRSHRSSSSRLSWSASATYVRTAESSGEPPPADPGR